MAVAYCEECGKKVALKKSGACTLCGHQIIEDEKKKGLSALELLIGLAVGFGGIYLVYAYDSMKEENKRIELAEKRAIEQSRLQEDRESAERKVRLEKLRQERETREAACAKSTSCMAQEKISLAEVYCPERVERYAKHDVKWTDDGFLERKFTQYRIKDEQHGIVTYLGDKVKFQNGFGAWSNIIYSCDININTEKVLTVNVTEGRL